MLLSGEHQVCWEMCQSEGVSDKKKYSEADIWWHFRFNEIYLEAQTGKKKVCHFHLKPAMKKTHQLISQELSRRSQVFHPTLRELSPAVSCLWCLSHLSAPSQSSYVMTVLCRWQHTSIVLQTNLCFVFLMLIYCAASHVRVLNRCSFQIADCLSLTFKRRSK